MKEKIQQLKQNSIALKIAKKEKYKLGTVAKRRKACNKLIANMIENSYLSKR